MPQISLPKEFFVKERNGAYASWKTAFWRELISNSADAGATEIAITHNGSAISFEDNGEGMSREVCEAVYLSVGRSSKGADGKGVGGFGRARILTCFSMDAYSIFGDGYEVHGSGADYDIYSGVERKGLKLTITDSAFNETFKSYLREFLNLCNLPKLSISWNGQPIADGRYYLPEWKDAPKVDDEFWADVGLAKAPAGVGSMQIIFRVNGLCMYDCGEYSLPRGSNLIVDIKPDVSRRVLTANRDGIKPSYIAAIQLILKEINQTGKLEDESILLRKNSLYGRPSNARSRSFTKAAKTGDFVAKTAVAFGGTLGSFLGVPLAPVSRAYSATPMILYISTRDPQLKTLAMSYEPGRERPGQRALLAAWDAACDLAIQSAGRLGFVSHVSWFTGFCFSSAQALFAKHSGQPCFLLNPYHKVGGEWVAAFNLSTQLGVQKLMSVAAHEVTHLLVEDHSTDYANALTDIVGALDWAKWRAVKEGLVAQDGLG